MPSEPGGNLTPWESALAEWDGDESVAVWFAIGRLALPICDLAALFREPIRLEADCALFAGYAAERAAREALGLEA